MGMNGSALLLLANTGTPSVPVYSVVGSQRDASIEESDAGIDFSSKDSRAQKVGPGRYSSTISLDALYVPDNEAYLALKSALRNGTLILIARQESDVVIETVNARVDSIGGDFPDQGEATISISLTADGFWEEVTS